MKAWQKGSMDERRREWKCVIVDLRHCSYDAIWHTSIEIETETFV